MVKGLCLPAHMYWRIHTEGTVGCPSWIAQPCVLSETPLQPPWARVPYCCPLLDLQIRTVSICGIDHADAYPSLLMQIVIQDNYRNSDREQNATHWDLIWGLLSHAASAQTHREPLSCAIATHHKWTHEKLFLRHSTLMTAVSTMLMLKILDDTNTSASGDGWFPLCWLQITASAQQLHSHC